MVWLVRFFLCSAIASHVSRSTWVRRNVLRRGSSRLMLDAAARLRRTACATTVRHALHVCVPSSPEGRFPMKSENCCCGLRWWHAAHFQEPRVFVWHCKHTLRLGSLAIHAEAQKWSFVCLLWQTKHSFLVSHEIQTRYPPTPADARGARQGREVVQHQHQHCFGSCLIAAAPQQQ